MRAWVHTITGKPADVLSLTEVPLPPLPKPESADVLVKITHASVCSGGVFLVAILPTFFRDKPCIPEFEFSGVVMAVDPEGSNSSQDPPLKVGDSVFGIVPIGRTMKRIPGSAIPSGALAEYVVVPSNHLARKPENVTFEQAAGLGGSSVTMAKTMIMEANLASGNRVLVYGASSAIGTFAVQMAKEIVGETGRVIAVCGPRGQQVMKDLGADEVCIAEHFQRSYKC